MKTKNLIKVFGLSLLLLMVMGCEDFLDINTNPNAPEVVPENLQLGALLGNFSYQIIGNEPARTPALWIQQIAFNGVAPSADNYLFNESNSNNLWSFWAYPDILNNAREIDRMATENGNYAYAGIAKVMQAWMMSIITDLFNDAPYSEAFNPLNTTPKYDTQESIYEAIFDLLDDAIEDFGKHSPRTPGRDDLLYGGDMTKWNKLAHTLKARFHLRLSRAPGNNPATRAQAALNALQSGFESNDDNAEFRYHAVSGQENPWFQYAIDGKWSRTNQMSHHYIELLKELNDPRLSVQARVVGEIPNVNQQPDPQPGEYSGHVNGADGIGVLQVSSIGSFYSNANAALNWLSYAEALFIKAEATFILSGASVADPIYRDAVNASIARLRNGVPAAELETYDSQANEYVNNLPTLTAAGGLRDIMTQKYIANFLNPEAYNDWRRTGYPELSPVQSQPRIDEIPRRYPYPSHEMNYNQANLSQTGVPSGYNAMKYRVWWDTRD